MELFGLVFVFVGLMKFISAHKMMIMLISLELSSIFLFFLFSVLGKMGVSLCSLFLVLVVCESVLVLVLMVSVFRVGSLMVSSVYELKF